MPPFTEQSCLPCLMLCCCPFVYRPAAAAAESWIQATGVPLLETLRQMSLQAAAARCTALVAATVLGVLLGNKLLALIGAKVGAGAVMHAFVGAQGALWAPEQHNPVLPQLLPSL